MSVFALMLFLAQTTANSAPPPPPSHVFTTPAPSAGERRSWRDQIFISPAGEPFRVPEGQPYPVADWFARADADHDGKLTEAEMIADFRHFAAIVDTNHDGTIDGTEVEFYETETVPEVHSGSFMYSSGGGGGSEGKGSGGGGETQPSNGPPADSHPMGAGKYALINLPEPIAAMDVDISGRITRREVAESASYRFSLLDPQGKGVLTLADLPKTFAQGHKATVRRRR